MSSTLRYYAYDLSTLAYKAEIPASALSGVTFSSELNNPGQFSGTLKLTDPAAQGISPLLVPGNTAIVADLNGSPAWGGILWTKKYTRSRLEAELGGSEWWSYFGSRVQANDYTNTWASTATDPVQIAYTVVNDALGVSYPSQDLYSPPFSVSTVGATPSPSWITASYPLVQYQTVDSIVTALAAQGYEAGGFDVLVTTAYGSTPATLDVGVVLSYPRAGNIYGTGGWVATADISSDWVTEFEYPEDATQTANKTIESGMGGSGYSFMNVAGVGSRWVLLEQVKTHSGVDNPSPVMLFNWAIADVAVAAWPAVAPLLTVRSDSPVGPSVVHPGDDLRVHVPGPGFNQYPPDPMFPSGFDIVWRVEHTETTVNPEGVATTAITLNVPPSTTPYQPPL